MNQILLTPGPLSCSNKVKETMLIDYSARHESFIEIISNLRNKLVRLVTNNIEKYTSILIPGSGTYTIEAILSSTISSNDKLALLINGVYGLRMNTIANIHNINTIPYIINGNESFEVIHIEKLLNEHPDITHIGMVHCETTTGILNNIIDIGAFLKDKNKIFFVDSMSSFGGIPIDIEECNINYLISSSNKCLHGPPGISFCIANKNSLEKCKNISNTLSLDLFAQWEYLEINKSFRFTPPTHIVAALYEAVIELENIGGPIVRNQQYTKYNKIILKELEKIGFEPYLNENQSRIISSWKYPKENFKFDDFYNYLNKNNIIIYPGKLSTEDIFRIGNIGNLTEEDIYTAIDIIKKYYCNKNN